MAVRKTSLVTGECYHVFSRSIARFTIFRSEQDYCRMRDLCVFFTVRARGVYYRFARFMKTDLVQRRGFDQAFKVMSEDQDSVVQIVAYCLMPTHIHLVLRQSADEGISQYMSNVLNSYARYFNTKYKREGPLWSGRFKNVLVSTDEQLLHLTRYVHLNPSSAGLVFDPEEWPYSSLREYIAPSDEMRMCRFEGFLEGGPGYRKFVKNHKDYQRNLSRIKALILEDEGPLHTPGVCRGE